MKKVRVLLVLACVLALGVTGCKKETKEEPTKDTTKKVEKPVEKEEEPEVKEEIPANQNLLTGLTDLSEEAIGKRPVAVMVNNVEKAMPQYGVAEADIIFEMPVEGDVTRFMALYADYTKVPKVCAVRSCRYYYPVFSQGFDAFYVNWGIDDSIADYLESLNLDQYDGMYDGNGLFGRDQARLDAGYGLEHTAYFDGTKFAGVVQANGKRTDLAEDKKRTAFQFNGLNEQLKPEGNDCTKVDINFGAQTATLTYDADKKVYLKQLNGNPQIDGNTQEQLAFTNVFIMETSITVRDEIGHKDMDCMGSDKTTAYYVSNGAVQKVHWKKDGPNEKAPLKFFDDNGKEIKVNRGKSYIAVNYPSQVTFQ